MNLKTLSIVTGILFIISLFVFYHENRRGSDLLAGSDYIKGLDINKIEKIVLSFKEDKKITLVRDSNHFVLENHKSYPAATDKVNDLIYRLASIQVKDKIASGVNENDLKDFELDEDSKHYLVELFDNDGKKTISFRVGKSHKGKGNYLFKEGSDEVYLSQNSFWINSSYKDFIDTVLLEVKKDEVAKIDLKDTETNKEIALTKKDNNYVLERPEGIDSEKLKKDKIEEYLNSFKSVRFKDFYMLTEPDVQSLSFDKDIKIHLKNKLVYKLSLAKKKKEEDTEYFVKLNALMDEIPRKLIIKHDDDKEKLMDIEAMAKAQGDAHQFNREKGAWVYKIDESIYKKLAKDSSFFM